MKLYLVRHGQAAKGEDGGEAKLTDEGAEGARRVAEFLARSGSVAPAAIRHSTKLRARQTAEILAERLGAGDRVEEMSGLSPNDPVGDVADGLVAEAQDLVLVGHLPFMDRLASLLLAGSDEAAAVEFPPAGVLCLRRTDEATRDARFRLSWMIRPDLLA
ncbi:MAG: phosphohistidine phosphatase SixA [Planctomycetota bacterium]|jgi:phosphohistidine phosphatase